MTLSTRNSQFAGRQGPITSLSYGLLSAIFIAGCHATPPGAYSCAFEVAVSHVSRAWRAVALSTPQIWARIYLATYQFAEDKVVETYLSRSAGLPLELYIVIQEDFIERRGHLSLPRSIALLLPRLLHLRVQSSSEVGLSALLDLLSRGETKASMVQSIELDLTLDLGRIGKGSEYRSKLFPGGALNLSSLRVRGMNLCLLQPHLPAVTSLELYGSGTQSNKMSTPNGICHMLGGLPALTHLTICDLYTEPLVGAGIELPCLKSLHIRPSGAVPNQTVGFLAIISSPNLTTLSLESLCIRDVDSFKPIASKYPLLDSLTLSLSYSIDSYAWNFHKWGKLSFAFPSITHFTLAYDPLGSFLAALQGHISSRTGLMVHVWHKLSTLTFIECPQLDVASLIRAISIRIQSDIPIQKLEFSKSSMPIYGSDLQHLRESVEIKETEAYSDRVDKDFLVDW